MRHFRQTAVPQLVRLVNMNDVELLHGKRALVLLQMVLKAFLQLDCLLRDRGHGVTDFAERADAVVFKVVQRALHLLVSPFLVSQLGLGLLHHFRPQLVLAQSVLGQQVPLRARPFLNQRCGP